MIDDRTDAELAAEVGIFIEENAYFVQEAWKDDATAALTELTTRLAEARRMARSYCDDAESLALDVGGMGNRMMGLERDLAESRAEVAALREALTKAIPFIGWQGDYNELVDECMALVNYAGESS